MKQSSSYERVLFYMSLILKNKESKAKCLINKCTQKMFFYLKSKNIVALVIFSLYTIYIFYSMLIKIHQKMTF